MADEKVDIKSIPLSQHINLKVMNQDGIELNFRIKKQTTLKKLMETFCQKMGLDIASIRFQFDGERICETDTPAKLQMDDGDSIDVFQQQIAGKN